jgi:hypothetical protein
MFDFGFGKMTNLKLGNRNSSINKFEIEHPKFEITIKWKF